MLRGNRACRAHPRGHYEEIAAVEIRLNCALRHSPVTLRLGQIIFLGCISRTPCRCERPTCSATDVTRSARPVCLDELYKNG